VGTVLAGIFVVGGIAGAISVFSILPPLNPNTTPTAVLVNTPSFDAALVEANVSRANPARGSALFSEYGCSACHGVPNGTGPYVQGLDQRAATRRPGYSAAVYLYESITDPNAFIVPNYPANVMPQNFKAIIPPDSLYDLIAWLLTQ